MICLKINKPIQMQGLGFSNWQSDCEALGYNGLCPESFYTILAILAHAGLYWLWWPFCTLYWLHWAIPRITSWTILSYLRNSPGCLLVRDWSEVKMSLSDQSKPPEQRGNPKPGHLCHSKSCSELNAMRATFFACQLVQLWPLLW